MFPMVVQLSVAVAVPVLAGNCEAPQLIVVFAGQAIIGAWVSFTVTVLVQVLVQGAVPTVKVRV